MRPAWEIKALSRCCKQVRSEGMGFHWHQCFSAGKVTRDGKLFCRVHDPVAVQARHDKRDARWAAKRVTDHARYEESARLRARAELCVAACVGLTDDEVRAMIKPRRTESFLLEIHEYDEPS